MAIPASFPPDVRSAAYDPRVRVRAGAAQPPEALAAAEPRAATQLRAGESRVQEEEPRAVAQPLPQAPEPSLRPWVLVWLQRAVLRRPAQQALVSEVPAQQAALRPSRLR